MAKKKIALMGNPNVGKSTVFNEITGSHQHTGNWTGKTVDSAVGYFSYKFIDYELIDLPGTYSLLASSKEEQVARDYLCFEKADCIVVVIDSAMLMKNLNLVYQIAEVKRNIILLLNMTDEAKKRGIEIDAQKLSTATGIPVVKATARSGKGVNELLEQIHLICTCQNEPEPATVRYSSSTEAQIKCLSAYLNDYIPQDKRKRFFALRLLEGDKDFCTSLKEHISDEEWRRIERKARKYRARLNENDLCEEILITSAEKARKTESECVKVSPSGKELFDERLDKILLGKYSSVIVMLAVLGVVLWLTITGSNYPSELLRELFDSFEKWIAGAMASINMPDVVISIFVNGILRVLLWVIAVMLPPMAIFFPLFSILEEAGILPRFAFNLDKPFEHCGACGKQALCTCMGLGCNAVGVMGCRIIDSPRERLIAIITNSLTPCNGRFPLLIAIISMFFCKSTFGATGILLGFLVLSLLMTFISAGIMSKTVLKGKSSSMIIELPSYKKPDVLKILKDTIREKILTVLGRAVVIACPAGALIWLMANISINGATLLSLLSEMLEPLGKIMGLDGVMLIAFILSFPANEITIPIALMVYLATNELCDYSSLEGLRNIFVENGWTTTTALCTCIFSMFHFPCSTTLLTIYRETRSVKWSALSVLVPLTCGFVLCVIVNFVSQSIIQI